MTHPENDLRDAVALRDELATYSAQLTRMETQAGFAGPETSVRVKDPAFLAQLLIRARAALDVRLRCDLAKQLAKARADLERVTAERDEAVAGLAQAATNIEKLSAAIRGAAPILKARALAAEAENTRLRALLVDAGEALRPFTKLSFSFDGFSFEPAEMVVLGHCCGKFHSKEHDHLQRAIDAAQAALAALDKAPTPKEPA